MALPTVTASDVIVVNIAGVEDATDTVYYTKGTAGATFDPASCVKVMTLWTIDQFRSGDFSGNVTITSEDDAISGSSVPVNENDVWPFETLSHGMITASGNDAAHALARTIGAESLGGTPTTSESLDEFHSLMNDQATALGLLDSSFGSASGFGFGSANAISTRDMATICKVVFTDSDLKQYFKWGRQVLFYNSDANFTTAANSQVILGDGTCFAVKGGSTGGTAHIAAAFTAPSGDTIAIITFNTDTTDRYPDWLAIRDQLLVDFPDLAVHADEFHPEDWLTGMGTAGAWIDPSLGLDHQVSTRDGDLADTSGDPVGSATDHFGFSSHFGQATSGSRPTLMESGGLWWYDFDGTDDFLDLGATALGDMSLFCGAGQAWMGVIVAGTDGQGTYLAKAGSTTGNRTFQIYAASGGGAIVNWIRRGDAGPFDDGQDNVGPNVFGFAWDGERAYWWGARGTSGESCGLREYVPGNNAEETSQRILLGARTNGANFVLDGRIYAALIADYYDEDEWRRAMTWYQENTQGVPAAAPAGNTLYPAAAMLGL